MSYRKPPAPRSPPRNFKVNYIEDPPLTASQKTYITQLVPKIGRASSTC